MLFRTFWVIPYLACLIFLCTNQHFCSLPTFDRLEWRFRDPGRPHPSQSPVLIHLQGTCSEPMVFQPWSFSYSSRCCLALVLELGITQMWNLNLYWFLSSFSLLWSFSDLENAMDRSSRLSVLLPWWRSLLLEWKAQVERGTRESKESSWTQGIHSNTFIWMRTLFHPQTTRHGDWGARLTTPVGQATFKKVRISRCPLEKLKGWSIGPLLIKCLPLSAFPPGHW